jgi:G3E family GTPase
MVEQIEFANVILINGVDIASPDALLVARRITRALNTKEPVIETVADGDGLSRRDQPKRVDGFRGTAQ